MNIDPTAPFLIVRDASRPPWWKRLWRRITGRKPLDLANWSPFGADGKLDADRLKREGWFFADAWNEDR